MASEGTAETMKEPKPTEEEKTAAPAEADADKVSVPATPAASGEDTPAEPASETSVDHSVRVYVGNLAWEVTSLELTDHIKAAGLEVKSANVMTSPDGRSKGCGIVEFVSADAAKEAVQKMNDTELKGRPIFVREDRGERKASTGVGGRGFDRFGGSGRGRGRGAYSGRGATSQFSSNENSKDKRVYVGNLSWEVAWQDLKDHMIEAGEVVRAEVIKEPSGRSKGCGIVEFATEDGAKKAISELTDTELKGRRIFVREDREITKAGGRGPGAGRGRGGRRFDNNR